MRGAARLYYRALGSCPTRIDGVDLRADPYHIGFWRDVASGRWEPGAFEFLRQNVRTGSSFLDVGAWIGPLTLAGARRCGVVYAFEPDPVAYRFLLWNLELNGIRNVIPYHAALASRSGTRVLSAPGGALGTSRSSLSAGGQDGCEVLTCAWTEWLERERPGRIGCIKIDIEGGEFELIPAMGEYLRTERPSLLLSMHPAALPEARRGTGMGEMVSALKHYSEILDEEGRAITPQEFARIAGERNASFVFRG